MEGRFMVSNKVFAPLFAATLAGTVVYEHAQFHESPHEAVTKPLDTPLADDSHGRMPHWPLQARNVTAVSTASAATSLVVDYDTWT
jgi:hypothetical protein